MCFLEEGRTTIILCPECVATPHHDITNTAQCKHVGPIFSTDSCPFASPDTSPILPGTPSHSPEFPKLPLPHLSIHQRVTTSLAITISPHQNLHAPCKIYQRYLYNMYLRCLNHLHQTTTIQNHNLPYFFLPPYPFKAKTSFLFVVVIVN